MTDFRVGYDESNATRRSPRARNARVQADSVMAIAACPSLDAIYTRRVGRLQIPLQLLKSLLGLRLRRWLVL